MIFKKLRVLIIFPLCLFLDINATGCGDNDNEPDPSYAVIPALSVEGTRIIDEHGRTVLLHGLNLSHANEFPQPSRTFIPDWIDEQVFAEMADKGFNVVRLIMVWEAVEPQLGVYNMAYLEDLKRIVRLANDKGILTILDMHQDLFSRAYGGDGAPDWALPWWPFPIKPITPWFFNYVRPVVLTAFTRFWRDTEGIQTKFRESWAQIATWFRDEPGIAGYDLLNEPFPGFLLLSPDRFDREQLGPFIIDLVTRIREVDPNHIIFFEPSAVRTNMLAPFGFPSALPDYLGDNLAFAPHFYDPIVTMTNSWNGDNLRLEMAADGLVNEAKRHNAALWVGEWDVWDFSVEGARSYLDEQLELFDNRSVSWSFWEYNLDDTSCPFTPGSPNAWAVEALDRPYPQRCAGLIENLAFNLEDGQFVLELRKQEGLTYSSEIYLPEHVYSDSFTVHVSDSAMWGFDPEKRILKINPPVGEQEQIIEVLP